MEEGNAAQQLAAKNAKTIFSATLSLDLNTWDKVRMGPDSEKWLHRKPVSRTTTISPTAHAAPTCPNLSCYSSTSVQALHWLLFYLLAAGRVLPALAL